MGTIVVRLGGFLALFGFGSALLHFTDVQFKLLMWSEPYQPTLGLIVGGVGALLMLVPILMSKDQPEVAQPAAAYPPPGAPAGAPAGPAPAGMSYGPPSGPQPMPGAIPQQGPQYGQRPPQGPPQQWGPQGPQQFGPRR